MEMTLQRLETLIQPSTGLIDHLYELPAHPGEPQFHVHTGHLGNFSRLINPAGSQLLPVTMAGPADGSGSGITRSESTLRALAETLERYSSCIYDDRQFLWATAADLGGEALDLDTLPRCSDTEYAHPRCPVVPPDKHAPIRWVRGINLHDGRVAWIPAVLCYLNIPALARAERFCMPISTGCAAHTSIEDALLSGLCEVLERDAVTLTWLQRLPLPRIDAAAVDTGSLQTHFFDATTDLGIPTIYCVQQAPHNPKLTTVVGCDTALDPARSIEKLHREVASCRIALQAPRATATERDEFHSVYDGAMHTGSAAGREAFDFLLNSTRSRPLESMPRLTPGTLRGVLGRLKERGMEAYAVDLSTDEAIRVGMRVVRVIVPEAMPLSFSYRARFLGSPRLYEAPKRMGYAAKSEANLNPWPQPFA